MEQKSFLATLQPNTAALGPRQAKGIASDGTVDRGKDVVNPAGMQPSVVTVPVHYGHDTSKPPIGRAVLRSVGGVITADIEFVPAGTSALADEVCAAVKCGAATDISIGFTPLTTSPRRGADGKGVNYETFEVHELSICSTGMNRNAKITQRALADRNSPAAKAARMAQAAAIARRVAAEDARARLPIDPAKAARIERARRIAAGESPADLDRPAPVPQVKQHDPDAARRAACSEAFLRVDANSPESRQRRAAELATEPTEKAQRVREAELARQQRTEFQKRYGRDAT